MTNPPSEIHNTIARLLENPSGWDAIYLEQNAQRIGGLIVVRNADVFDKVVLIVNERCKPAEVKG